MRRETTYLRQKGRFVKLKDDDFLEYDGSIYSPEFPKALRNVFQRKFGTNIPEFHKRQINAIIKELKAIKKPISDKDE